MRNSKIERPDKLYWTHRLEILTVIIFLLLIAVPVGAVLNVPMYSVSQITVDAEGRRLSYPSSVYYDPVMEEMYLINGGSGRIIVYGPDFFPRVAIGSGRGVVSPTGVSVTSDGEVYVCQARTAHNPIPKITILNGAFFVDREIHLDQIPETQEFRPRQAVASDDGLIYVAGDNERGVVVLDQDGSFMRWLRPQDDIIYYGMAPPGVAGAGEETDPEAAAKAAEDEKMWADIPEEFRPRSALQENAMGPKEAVGPVKINYIARDSNGRLYLVSSETGKIYVYGPDEKLLFSFGRPGGSPGQLSQPRGLAVDEERKLIYVIDYMRHTMLVYNMEGKHLYDLGGRGTGPGWFNFPMSVAVNKQHQMAIADLYNKRLQILEVNYEDVLLYLRGGLSEDDAATDIAVPDSVNRSEPTEALEPARSENETDAEVGNSDSESAPSSPPTEQSNGAAPASLQLLIEDSITEELIIEEGGG